MLANREGSFNAYPVAIGIGQSRQNKLLQAVINYQLVEEQVDGQWVDCTAESMEITGYHVLEKKDHSLNTNTIESLKASLGWDGSDPFWLQDNADQLAQHPVQVKLIAEEYEGQRSIKVQYLNPYGSNFGGVPKADDEMRKSIGNRLGTKFRALAGGTSTPAPKPAGKPGMAKPISKTAPARQVTSAPAATAPQAPASATATAELPEDQKIATADEAWGEFSKAYEKLGPKGTPKDCEQQWFTILAELFPGRQPAELSPQDWAIMLKSGPSKIIPF